MSRFVTTLRARPTTLRLAGEQTALAWTVRVQCAEAWDAVRVEISPDARVRDVKRAAMTVLTPDIDDLNAYVVKLRGLEIFNEDESMRAAGAVDGSTLLVTSRRRRPVR